MKIIVDTDKLSLPGPGAGAGWEVPTRVSIQNRDSAIDALHKLGLAPHEIERLLAEIGIDAQSHAIMAKWPTVGKDKKALKAVADLSGALAVVLHGLSPKAHAELATASLKSLGVVTAALDLERPLMLLSAGLRQRISTLPSQSRATPRTQLVRAVWALQSPVLGKPSTWPESEFYKACEQVFVLAGLGNASPDKAIKALKARIKTASGLDASPSKIAT